ncbi:gamma-glutamylcyclotransferase family protein [Martelella mangrovi]|uniref:Gamma-glutamylcyclotransferase n=1 Tax=Martelella mangrovi TaxID=1397477 RepID=A0ABV2I6J4_9HYPH
MPQRLNYFAYGSNMLTERLFRRCPSARALGGAFLEDHTLDFAKPGRDGSGKATIVPAADARVFGVLFTLEPGDCGLLDGFEGRGKGYDRLDDVTVCRMPDGRAVSAFTYMAPPAFRDPAFPPYDWYHGLVIAGAHEHGLPEDYIAGLLEIPFVEDPEADRATRREALDILAGRSLTSRSAST